MPEEIYQALNILKEVSYPAAGAIVFYFLFKSGVLSSLASRVRKSVPHERIEKLEQFQDIMEGNHNTDLKELLSWKVRVDTRLDKLAEDVGYLRGRVNGKN